MATNNLARVRWQMGQTLLPQHFVAQEDAERVETSLRFQLSGAPPWGVGRLSWNDGLLAEGILSIQKLTVIFPSGLLVDVPGNATVPPFNMNMVGSSQLPVYLHLLEKTDTSREELEDQGETLDRIVYRLVLTTEQTLNAALHSMKLTEFAKDPEGGWSPREWALPTLVQVGASPFLRDALTRLDALLDHFHFKLSRRIAGSFLSGESLASVKSCLKAVYQLKGFLAHLRERVHPHPFVLYEALREFYLEVCFYQDATPEHGAAPYRHDDPGPCFQTLFDAIVARIQQIRTKEPYLSFEQRDGKFILEPLPDELRLAQEAYLLIQKPRVSTIFSIEGVKLASEARLSTVHQLALKGIPLQKIDRPPFQHPFGPEVEFYRVREGEEWDQALKDNSLAFFQQEGFEDLSAFVYWRQG